MSTDLAATRYAALIEQLGSEKEFSRGWMTHVAKRLGIHRSYVSRIHAGDRSGIGRAAIERAMSELNIRAAFFYREMDDEPHYLDFTPLADEVFEKIDVAPRHTKYAIIHTNAYWTSLCSRAIVFTLMLDEWGAHVEDADSIGSEFVATAIADLAEEVLDMPVLRHAFEVAAGGLDVLLGALFLREVSEMSMGQSAYRQSPLEERDVDRRLAGVLDDRHAALAARVSWIAEGAQARIYMPLFLAQEKVSDVDAVRTVVVDLAERVLRGPLASTSETIRRAHAGGHPIKIQDAATLLKMVIETGRYAAAFEKLPQADFPERPPDPELAKEVRDHIATIAEETFVGERESLERLAKAFETGRW